MSTNETRQTVCHNLPTIDCMMELVTQLMDIIPGGWEVKIGITSAFITVDVLSCDSEIFTHTASDADELLAAMLDYVNLFEEADL